MSKREELVLKASGLATFADVLSKVPEGSLSVAKNIVIDKDGLISPRRGYELLDGTSGLGDISSIHAYAKEILIHSNSTLTHYDGTNWNALTPSITTPTEVEKIRSITYNKNIYFTSDGGVQKLDNVAGPITNMGAPRGLNAVLTQNSATYGSAIPAASDNTDTTTQTVAYRFLWGYKDANDNLIKGSPSQREIFTHSSDEAVDVDIELYIPNNITTAWFYQVYRSDAVTEEVDVPLDEMKLAYEGNPLQAEIDAGVLNVTDVQPEAMLGEALYTNPTQQGILQANDEPPKCRDMAVYQSHTFFANTETKYQMNVQLLGVNPCDELAAGVSIGGASFSVTAGQGIEFPTGAHTVLIDSEEVPVTSRTGDVFTLTGTFTATHSAGATVTLKGNGLSEGDIITINSVPFTAKYTTSPAAQEFSIYSDNDPAYDVELTARSLTAQINAYSAANPLNIVALYISTGDVQSLPGQITLQETDFSAAMEFGVSATSVLGDSAVDKTWTPKLLASENQTSKNERKPNRVYYSKFQVPEAVPALNFFDVGAANDTIIRILPLRTALLIFTEAGIYRLTGTTAASFQVTLLDNTTKLLAADSAVVFNNAVYGLFDQGIGSVSQAVNILSRPIEGDLLEIIGAIGTTINSVFGIGYESDRKYIIYMPRIAGGKPEIAYVYNTVTNSWTNYDLGYNHGIVDPASDKLYMVGNNLVHRERKNYSEFDITDPQEYGIITAVSGVEVSANAGLVAISSVKDVFLVNNRSFSPIVSIDTLNNKFTLQDSLEFPEPELLFDDISDTDTSFAIADVSKYYDDDYIVIDNETIQIGKVLISSTLNGAIDDTQLTITLLDGSVFPTGKQIIKIDDEEILIDSRTANVFTVNASGRGYNSTIAESHLNSSIVDSVNSISGAVRGTRLTTAASHTEGDTVYPSCEVRSFFNIEVEWNPVFMEHPATLKQFSECTLLTNLPLQGFDVGFKTWSSTFYENISFSSSSYGFWGIFAWGDVPWGGDISALRYRTYIPRAKQRDSALVIRLSQDTALNNFEISGFSIVYRNIGSKTER